MTLGNFATKYVLHTTTGITRLRGQVHDWHGRTVIPTFHPAAILHGGGEESRQFELLRDDFRLVGLHSRSDVREPLHRPASPRLAGCRRRSCGSPVRAGMTSWSCSDVRSSFGRRRPRTRARSARRSRRCSARATPWCSRASSAPGRRRSCRASRGGSASRSRSSSPTFTLVKEYSGILDSRMSTSTAWTGSRTSSTWAWRSSADGEDVLLVEWGDAVEELLPDDRLRVELPDGPATPRGRAVGSRRRGRPGCERCAGARGGRGALGSAA